MSRGINLSFGHVKGRESYGERLLRGLISVVFVMAFVGPTVVGYRRDRLARCRSREGRRLVLRAVATGAGEDLQLYNTLSGTKDPFNKTVHEDGVVRFYSCGPTVYDSAHVGNFRAFLTYDVLKRWLMYRGFEVNHVMNLTDVDDKIIKRVQRENCTLEELTEKYSNLFFEDLALLNVIPAQVYPRATHHIDEIADMVDGLVSKGSAYERDGSTYFKVDAFEDYGKLVRLEKREAGAMRTESNDSDEYDKTDARDFALWKAYKEEDGEVKWDTKLGTGRPGWHIECSCMAMQYLGPEIDIHGGGIDLVFPHHENEIAQSEAFSGKQFARFWVHNGFVNIGGEKMSKSLGNFRTLSDVVQSPDDARAFRYLVVSSQYRSTLNFTEAVLKAARSTIKRLDTLRKRLGEIKKDDAEDGVEQEVDNIISDARTGFCRAMNDDLNTPRAVASMFELVSKVGKLLKAQKLNADMAKKIDDCLLDFDRVIGVFYKVPSSKGTDDGEDDDDGLVKITAALQELLDQRAEARKSKNFSKADEIRDELTAQGFVIKDTPSGAVLLKK